MWRLKGQFNIPDSTHATENDGTDGSGQEVVYTGINTTHKFTKYGKSAKAVNVVADSKKVQGLVTFFETVQTPDTVKAVVTA